LFCGVTQWLVPQRCPWEPFHLKNAANVEPVVCRHSPTYIY